MNIYHKDEFSYLFDHVSEHKITMILLRYCQWVLLEFMLHYIHINHIEATWPTSNDSNIRLLVLLQDAENASQPTDMSVHSSAMFKAAVLLSQQYNMTFGGQFIGWLTVKTAGSLIPIVNGICNELYHGNLLGIVGSPFSSQAPVTAEYAKDIGIPTVTYSATNPDLSNRIAYSALYRMVPSDTAAAIAIAKLLVRFNWTSCIIIYQNDQFGVGGVNAIKNELTAYNFTVANTVIFDIQRQSIQGNLSSILIGSASRIVVLWVFVVYTPLIVQLALDANVLGPKFTWILSSSIPLDSFNKKDAPKLIGMLSVEPAAALTVNVPINETLLNDAVNIWQQYEKETFPGIEKINNYALFAFDAAWILIQALEQLCSRKTDNTSCTSFVGSPYCFDRRFLHSKEFFDVINSMNFLGVSGLVQFNPNTTDRIGGAYYFVQNVQPGIYGSVFVPVLAYDEKGAWRTYSEATVIIWPGGVLTVPSSIASLNGVTLRIGVIPEYPFTAVGSTTNLIEGATPPLIGFVPDLIAELQKHLNFIPDIHVASTSTSYSQLVRDVANGKYDIVVADLTITSERRKIAGFSQPIFDNALYLMGRNTPDHSIDLFGFLRPFSHGLWLLSLGAVLVVGFVVCILERESNEALQNKSLISLLAMGVWYSFANVLGFGADYNITTAAGRFLTLGVFMFSIALVASYTANLASYLTIKRAVLPISGIDDIKAGKVPYGRIGIVAGSSFEEFYMSQVSNNVRNYHKIPAFSDLYDALLDKTIDYTIIDSGLGQYLTNNVYCNLTLIGQSFDQSSFGIVIPSGWNYQQSLDIVILALRESGFLDDLRNKWMQSSTCPQSSDDSSGVLGVEEMGGLFLVLGAIIVISLLFYVWKRYIKRRLFSLRTLRSIKRLSASKKHSLPDFVNEPSKPPPNIPPIELKEVHF